MAPELTRKGRGARMFKDLEFQCEEDQEFWTQEFFEEDDNDFAYEEEEASSSSDEVSSDFDEAEDAGEGEKAVEAAEATLLLEERRDSRKKSKYVDPAEKRKKQQQRQAAARARVARQQREAAADAKEEAEAEPKPKKRRKREEAPPDTLDGAARRSSRPQTAAKSQALEQRMEWEEACRDEAPPRRPARKRRGMTQEQRLKEAERTAAVNVASLSTLLHREEEDKQRRRAALRRHVTTVTGPSIRVQDSIRSGERRVLVIFRDHWPQVLSNPTKVMAPRDVCCITGRAARYRDPLSGLPYADAAAFTALRKCYELLWRNLPQASGGGKGCDVSLSRALPPPVRAKLNTEFARCLPTLRSVQDASPAVVQKALQHLIQGTPQRTRSSFPVNPSTKPNVAERKVEGTDGRAPHSPQESSRTVQPHAAVPDPVRAPEAPPVPLVAAASQPFTPFQNMPRQPMLFQQPIPSFMPMYSMPFAPNPWATPMFATPMMPYGGFYQQPYAPQQGSPIGFAPSFVQTTVPVAQSQPPQA